MITFYSGTPGSGKSLHVAEVIYKRLRYLKRPVICSFPVDLDYISKNGKKSIGKFVYLPYQDMKPEFFYDYALKNHVKGKEGQTLVVIDECQLLFNPREFGRSDRLKWIEFFTQHRHLGYDFILVSQFDMLVDKQIRCLFEYDIKHRKLNNYGFTRFLPVKSFIAVTFWYCVKKRVTTDFFIYRRKYSRIYNSFQMFDRLEAEHGAEAAVDTDGSVDGSPAVAAAASCKMLRSLLDNISLLSHRQF